MTEFTKCSPDNLKDIYLGYYNYITSVNPFEIGFSKSTYDITEYTKSLPENLLHHTQDGKPIVLHEDAKKLWEEARLSPVPTELRNGFWSYSTANLDKETKRRKIDTLALQYYLKFEHEEYMRRWGLESTLKKQEEKYNLDLLALQYMSIVEHEEYQQRLESKPESTPEKQEQSNGQDTPGSIPQTKSAKPELEEQSLIYNKISKCLTSSDGVKIVSLPTQQSKIMSMLTKNNPVHITNILNKTFNCEYGAQDNVNGYDRNRFDVAIGKINKACRVSFGIEQLVKSFRGGKYGLTVKINPIKNLTKE